MAKELKLTKEQIESVSIGDLRSAVKAFNDAKLQDEKLKGGGAKEEVMKNFTLAVDAAGKKKANKGKIPKKTVEIYMLIWPPKSSTKATTTTAPAKKKEPVAVSCYGHREGTQAAGLDEMLKKGATLEAMADKFSTPKTRVQSHIADVKRRGWEVDKNDKGVYKVTGPAK